MSERTTRSSRNMHTNDDLHQGSTEASGSGYHDRIEESPAPSKDKKNKKRQKKAAAASATAAVNEDGSGSTSRASSINGSNVNAQAQQTEQQSPAKKHRKRTKPKASKMMDHIAASNMEEGEVDELDGLFFVDTTPRPDMRKDVANVPPPPSINLPRRTSASASPSTNTSTSGSASPPPTQLFNNKVVPDYVGSTEDIKEADIITDSGAFPVEGSSKDLLESITGHASQSNSNSEQMDDTVKHPVQAAVSPNKRRAVEDFADGLPTGRGSPSSQKKQKTSEPIMVYSSDVEPQEEEAPAKVTQSISEKQDSSTSPLVHGEHSTRQAAEARQEPAKVATHKVQLLEDLMSDDESTSEEDEQVRQSILATLGGKKSNNQIESESESDGQTDYDRTNNLPDDLALNMEIDTVGAAPIMEIDTTGALPRPSEAKMDETATRADAISTEAAASTHQVNDVADDSAEIIGEEIIADDEHQVDRSRYFREDDPLKVCARCGETGHTVRDCAHVQCLTCGKLDDHGTRSCPLTMNCFRCNGRGHHIKDCPMTPEEARLGSNQFCERCSAHTHQSSTCPYIWRVYIRASNAPTKPGKIRFACYNCASPEHFGDDCKFPRGHPIANSERTAFTSDPEGTRKTHIRFDNGSSGGSSRSNNVNGRKEPQVQMQAQAPPSHAPRGPKSMLQHQQPVKRKEFPKNRHGDRPSLEQAIRDGDFGDMGDMEAGEIDEDEDNFVKRLEGDKNNKKNEPPQQPKGPRPGARDRRKARDTSTSVNGDHEPPQRRSFQPFKDFKEAPRPSENSSLNRPRSLSPPPERKRRRDERQPSPAPMDSPAAARSTESWRKGKDKGLQNRIQRMFQGPESTNDRSRGGGGGAGGSDGSRAASFATGSLLDRIDRGSQSKSASRDPRRYDNRDRHDEDPRRGGSSSSNRRGGDSYVPDRPSGSNGGNPRYKGGYF